MAILTRTVQDRSNLRVHLQASVNSLRFINSRICSRRSYELQTKEDYQHNHGDPFKNLYNFAHARDLRRCCQISTLNETRTAVITASVNLRRPSLARSARVLSAATPACVANDFPGSELLPSEPTVARIVALPFSIIWMRGPLEALGRVRPTSSTYRFGPDLATPVGK